MQDRQNESGFLTIEDEQPKGWVQKTWGWIGQNLAILMALGGLALIIIGSLGNDALVWFKGATTVKDAFLNFNEIAMTVGTAILGGGVFAVILKSAQFSKIFQDNIFQVVYTPRKEFTIHAISEKWKLLTDQLLRQVLPFSHAKATEEIFGQYFKKEIEYHFRNFQAKYDIEIDENGVATAINTTTTEIVLSPNVKNPVLRQNHKVRQGSSSAERIRINGSDIDLDQYLTPIKGESPQSAFELRIPLNDFADDDGILNFEKKVITQQTLSMEPEIKATVSRFVSGAAVLKAKVHNPDYELFYYDFGIGVKTVSSKDLEDYNEWSITSESGSLLLPGMGYILIISKRSNTL